MFACAVLPDGLGEAQPVELVQTDDTVYVVTEVVVPKEAVGVVVVGVDEVTEIFRWDLAPNHSLTLPPDTLRVAGMPTVNG